MKLIREIIEDETGDGLVVYFMLMSVISFMMLCLMLNFMNWNSERNGLQIMADSASRAGTVAISKSYPIRERNGHGLADYHVYTELNQAEAGDLSDLVIDSYTKKLKLAEVTKVEKNPIGGFTVPVWNSKTFQYDERSISTQKQYKNGNFSVLVEGKIKSIWPGLLGVKEELDVEVYSQSAARGKVTDIK